MFWSLNFAKKIEIFRTFGGAELLYYQILTKIPKK